MNPARFMVEPLISSNLAVEVSDYAPWFHNLHLPDGTQTARDHPLGDFPAFKWAQIASSIPQDLTGWTALDVGCNAGFYSFELAKRGAQVTAIDMDPHFLRQAAWAAGKYGVEASIDFRHASIYEVANWEESYDLVLFMGVFYHLRYPMLGLDILAGKTRKLMVFQTLSLPGDAVAETPDDQDFDDRTAMLEPGWPKMAFVEKSLAGDWTNWWVPNHAGVEAMLRSAGLDVISHPGHEFYLCQPRDIGHFERSSLAHELTAATGRSRNG